MKHILANKTKLFLVAGCALAVLTTGCIRETMDACAPHKLTVKVVNPNGEEITGLGLVEEASVYLFDKNYNHLKTVRLTKGQVQNYEKIELAEYNNGDQIYAVAWGNARLGNQAVSEGEIINQLQVALKTKGEVADSPDKLYHGLEGIVVQALSTTERVDTVTIEPKTGAIRMMTEGFPYALQRHNLLKNGVLKADTEVTPSLTLERTKSVYDYEGKLDGSSVYYEPDGLFTEDYEWVTSLDLNEFDNYATGTQIEASLDLNGTVLGHEVVDDEGKPLTVEAGVEKQVIFRFGKDGSFLGIKVIVRPWGYRYEDIVF